MNLQPHPSRQWASRGGRGAHPRRRRRATCTRPHGVRHVFDAHDFAHARPYGHVNPRAGRARFPEFCRYLRTLHPPEVRVPLMLDSFRWPNFVERIRVDIHDG